MGHEGLDLDGTLRLIEEAVARYDRTAPTVVAYLDDLYRRVVERPRDVRLVELLRVHRLRECGTWLTGNGAANLVYHLMHELGMDTTGQVGF
jgi:hypothetical protein